MRCILFLATDVFLFYVFFEVILVPMYFLIGGFGPGPRRTYAAAKFLIFGLLGGFVMLASVIGLYVQSAKVGAAELPAEHAEPAGHCDWHRPLAVRRLHVCVCDQGAAGAAAHLVAGCGGGVHGLAARP